MNVIKFLLPMQGQAPHKTLNALDLMAVLESETTSGSNSTQQLQPVFEDDNNDNTLTVPDPHDRGASPSRQKQSRDATTPTKKKTIRGKTQSTSMLSPGTGSGNIKNHSITSMANGRHSVHTSAHSSHNSQHHSSTESKMVRTRTVSVGSKPVSSSSTASQWRPSSGHASHRDKRHSSPSSHNS